MSDLELEHKEVFLRKDQFEKNLEKELDNFDQSNKNLLTTCLNSLFEVVKSRDTTELDMITNFLKPKDTKDTNTNDSK